MEIPDKVVSFFDGKLQIAHMATKRPDDHLAVVPIGVVIHEGQLRISSPAATFKVRNLRSDPHIALCIADPKNPARYIMVRGTAEVADDVGRAFVDWLARTHMGEESFPYESRDVARVVITVRPEQFVMPKVHGSN